jgi:hypothetical protein
MYRGVLGVYRCALMVSSPLAGFMAADSHEHPWQQGVMPDSSSSSGSSGPISWGVTSWPHAHVRTRP